MLVRGSFIQAKPHAARRAAGETLDDDETQNDAGSRRGRRCDGPGRGLHRALARWGAAGRFSHATTVRGPGAADNRAAHERAGGCEYRSGGW